MRKRLSAIGTFIANWVGFIRGRLSAISGYIMSLVGFIFFSIILLLLNVFITPSILLPGTIFRLPVFLGLLSAPFIVSYIFFSIPNRSRKRDTNAKKPVSNKALVIIFVICMLVPFAYMLYGNVATSQHLKAANKEFTIVQADPITQERINTTLVELDSQFSRLSNAYGPVPHPNGMKIVMYATVQSLQSRSIAQKWADAYFTFISGQPEIDIPAEQASSNSGGSNGIISPRPGHEIAHYVLFEIVGEQHYNQIPLWFNEGLAQYESLKGWEYTKTLEKDGYSIGLWLYNISNPNLLNDDKFLVQSKAYPSQNVDVFYVSSLEFVRYIDTHYGGIKNILHRVANGEDFSSAFQSETGKNYEQAYSEWHDAFFGH